MMLGRAELSFGLGGYRLERFGSPRTTAVDRRSNQLHHTCHLHHLSCNSTICNLRHPLHPRGVNNAIFPFGQRSCRVHLQSAIAAEPFGSNFPWAGRLQGAFAIWNCSRATYECSGPSCNCSRDSAIAAERFCNCSRDSAIAAESSRLQLQIAVALCRPSAQGAGVEHHINTQI